MVIKLSKIHVMNEVLANKIAAAEKRRLAGDASLAPAQRPDKKSRRQIHRFKRQEN